MNGISFGDYDRDGYPDLFSHQSGLLWRNVQGQTWLLAADLDSVLPSGTRYGSSFGDYNNDGLPDIATEPRRSATADTCLHLLKNLGNTQFVDIATNPDLLDVQPCNADGETNCWGDVDGDGDLDLFMPVYPLSLSSIDNQFLHNRGATGPGGQYRFTEQSLSAGLKIPPGANRPEGSQFCDTDFDGDLDLYSNGHLYHNISSFDQPRFEYLNEVDSGIFNHEILDEGALLFDYDRDGDFDLLVSYLDENSGVILWENYGDGSFFETTSTIESPFRGAGLGLSTADWDNDGDLDIWTLNVFRANLSADRGQRRFIVVPHNIPQLHMLFALPAWADWDRDGDLDTAISNLLFGSYFYQNDTYGPETPLEVKRHVRIRPLMDSSTVSSGLETEFGAVAEIHVHGEENGPRRKQFVASSSGYVNQNEYDLSFALPEDPAPLDPWKDVRFDVSVDFPSLPEQGFHQIDKFVNPALGNLNLANLNPSREIQVYRSGKVVIQDCELIPRPTRDLKLISSTGGLAVPRQNSPLPQLQTTISNQEFFGIEIQTHAAAPPLMIREIILDGHLGLPIHCGPFAANIFLWDVTDPNHPQIAPHGRWNKETELRNRRSYHLVQATLLPGRTYRLVARMKSFRGTSIQGPVVHSEFDVSGGLRFTNSQFCTGADVSAANVDPQRVYLAVRVAKLHKNAWVDLGPGSAHHTNFPQLKITGPTRPGSPLELSIHQAPAHAEVLIVIGSHIRCEETLGVRSIPAKEYVFSNFLTDMNGSLVLTTNWPLEIRRGNPLFIQAFVDDSTQPGGVSATNVMAALSE